LTLEEEYENQISWRTSADKLTFIVCKPLDLLDSPSAPFSGADDAKTLRGVVAGEADRDMMMVGDINLFLTPWENDEESDDGGQDGIVTKAKANLGNEVNRAGDERDGTGPGAVRYCAGEVDIMIAESSNRGKGVGKGAVSTFLWFIRENLNEILSEYAGSIGAGGRLEMKELLARINATNAGSIALFKALGFQQRGDVNYFGEIEMVLKDFASDGVGVEVEGYHKLAYDRFRLTE
jgi:hypothetical protein